MYPIISIFSMTTVLQLHSSPRLVEATSKHKFPCPQLSIWFFTQTNTAKRKQGNIKDRDSGLSLNGNDKRKISPVILIFPATLKFNRYNIRWNLWTGNGLRVIGWEAPTTYILSRLSARLHAVFSQATNR